jgi:flagellin-like hook-associated protein FlgL
MDDAHHIATVPKNSREELRVRVAEYRGHTYADLRTFVDSNGPDMVPTQKGVTVAPERIDALIQALTDARAEMARRGLLAG